MGAQAAQKRATEIEKSKKEREEKNRKEKAKQAKELEAEEIRRETDNATALHRLAQDAIAAIDSEEFPDGIWGDDGDYHDDLDEDEDDAAAADATSNGAPRTEFAYSPLQELTFLMN